MGASIVLSRSVCAPAVINSGASFATLAVQLCLAVAPAAPLSPIPITAALPAPAQPANGPAARAPRKRKKPRKMAWGDPSLAAVGCQVERPSQQEIAERAAAIRDGWSPQEFESRASVTWRPVAWELPLATGVSIETE